MTVRPAEQDYFKEPYSPFPRITQREHLEARARLYLESKPLPPNKMNDDGSVTVFTRPVNPNIWDDRVKAEGYVVCYPQTDKFGWPIGSPFSPLALDQKRTMEFCCEWKIRLDEGGQGLVPQGG